ncbi:hypothetical protein ACFWVC_38345 [Streptomyces sp. NPDC058691]|uniref:hypothetical protein n=1 Tax=Streptomyces sp. NPDC058691 TaxID=3346601 RepID=UPI0036632561
MASRVVAVEARGRGIGAALLKWVQLYGYMEYRLLFGKFDTERDLGAYCTQQGCSVLRPGQAVNAGNFACTAP